LNKTFVVKAEAPQITQKKGLSAVFCFYKRKLNRDEEHVDLLVLLTTLSNAVFPHDQRHWLALYGMLLEISWLLRILQYKFFACGVKA
jgi:hypothetical protein